MATGTAHGTNYALMAAPRVGTWPSAAICNAELYCLSEECYASGAALDAGSIMYIGKLPAGAVVHFSVVWPIDTATYGEGDDMTNAVTMEIGTLTDADLFGDVTDLNATATPQVIGVCPDGTTYTTTLDFALRSETTVIATTGGAALTATEGIAIKMFYTMAGRTYS
jgi:hypothetical protein